MKKETSSGISALGVLQIVFIVLKCVDLIDWPWTMVLIPSWISLGLTALAVVGVLIYHWLDR